MNILVCGGRDYDDKERLYAVLDELHAMRGVSFVVHGDAKGADRLAYQWAIDRGIDQACFPANWKGRGVSAGPYRNGLMIRFIHVDLVVAFPGGRGTQNMINQAQNAGISIMEAE